MELDLGQRQRGWGPGSETLMVRGMPTLWFGKNQALLLGWAYMDTDARPQDGRCSCRFRLDQRRHSVLNSDCGMPEGLPHQLSGDQCPGGCWMSKSRAPVCVQGWYWGSWPGMQVPAVYGRWLSSPSGSFPLLPPPNEILGNPTFCWDH